jgi:mannose-6-phosphate isomerase
MVGTVVELRGAVVSSAWGSHTLIPALRGNRPTRQPQAEVWFGAHPANPAQVRLEGELRAFDTVPGMVPPMFLLKLLAAAAPLSIQVHPDRERAQQGFAREEAAAVVPERRSYRDRSDKPELLRALTPMRVLCGLRPAGESRRLLSELVPTGLEDVLSLLSRGDAALPQVLESILRAPIALTKTRLAALARGLAQLTGAHPDVELARDLLARFPTDPGVLVALLMRPYTLAPGEAIFVPAGVLHAYLEGLGVELMAPSDNVVRGGLTGKHVDIDELLRIADLRAGTDPRVGSIAGAGAPGWRRYLSPTDAFVLDEATVDGRLVVERSGGSPSVLLCTEGRVTVRAADGSRAVLTPVRAAYLGPDVVPVELSGTGQVFHARAGSGALDTRSDGQPAGNA